MALIVEDGTGVPGATSFIDADFVRAFAAARGRTVPPEGSEGDAEIEQKATIASDFIATVAGRFRGTPTYSDQSLSFPRQGVVVNGSAVSSVIIPNDIKKAQAELTLAALDGFDLMPTLDGAEVKREKVGPLETEYVTGSARSAGPIVARAFALLQPFYATISLRVSRA